jgi:hypothetical protein
MNAICRTHLTGVLHTRLLQVQSHIHLTGGLHTRLLQVQRHIHLPQESTRNHPPRVLLHNLLLYRVPAEPGHSSHAVG